jgi:hypothetical protein
MFKSPLLKRLFVQDTSSLVSNQWTVQQSQPRAFQRPMAWLARIALSQNANASCGAPDSLVKGMTSTYYSSWDVFLSGISGAFD